jgi:hypothetical protein
MSMRVLFLCVAAAAFLFGCTQIPRQTMDEAKKSLAAAKKAGAESYAPSQLQAAQVAYDLGMKELSEENKKLPFMRKYHKIIETLLNAKSAAQSAADAAEASKKRIKDETSGLIIHLQATVDSVHGLFKEATKKKKDTVAVSQGIDSTTITIKEAVTALGSGDLILAKEKAIIANDRLAIVVKNADGLGPPKKASKKK